MMPIQINWQAESNNADNADNLNKIRQWWTNLSGKEIAWQQRLIPPSGNIKELNWEPQRFDEKFTPQTIQMRGITLYWQKPGSEEERNITPNKLELDTGREKLYIYPQSQSQVVIRVGDPEIIYQTVELQNPQIAGTLVGDNCILLLRDPQQEIEVKLILSSTSLGKLRESLPG